MEMLSKLRVIENVAKFHLYSGCFLRVPHGCPYIARGRYLTVRVHRVTFTLVTFK